MKPTFELEILTPQRKFYSERVGSVTLTLADGEAQFMSGHSPLVASVAMGFASIDTGKETKRACITNGTVIASPRSVVILVEAAEWSEEIDRARVEDSLKRAEERLADKAIFWQVERAEAARERAVNRLKFLDQEAKQD